MPNSCIQNTILNGAVHYLLVYMPIYNLHPLFTLTPAIIPIVTIFEYFQDFVFKVWEVLLFFSVLNCDSVDFFPHPRGIIFLITPYSSIIISPLVSFESSNIYIPQIRIYNSYFIYTTTQETSIISSWAYKNRFRYNIKKDSSFYTVLSSYQ